MIVETTTLRLRDGVDDATFLAADARVQTAFFSPRPGFVRRTTARGDDGWLVVTLWTSPEAAESALAAAPGDEAARAFASCVQTTTTARYETID